MPVISETIEGATSNGVYYINIDLPGRKMILTGLTLFQHLDDTSPIQNIEVLVKSRTRFSQSDYVNYETLMVDWLEVYF